jgi:hypothetical protein
MEAPATPKKDAPAPGSDDKSPSFENAPPPTSTGS